MGAGAAFDVIQKTMWAAGLSSLGSCWSGDPSGAPLALVLRSGHPTEGLEHNGFDSDFDLLVL